MARIMVIHCVGDGRSRVSQQDMITLGDIGGQIGARVHERRRRFITDR